MALLGDCCKKIPCISAESLHDRRHVTHIDPKSVWAVFMQPVSWPTFHGNMTDSSCLCDNISNSVYGNDEPGPVTHAARFMVLPWLYSRSGFSSLAATGFEFWSCGWVAEWQADEWLAGSWEDMTAGLYFGTIKLVTVIARIQCLVMEGKLLCW